MSARVHKKKFSISEAVAGAILGDITAAKLTRELLRCLATPRWPGHNGEMLLAPFNEFNTFLKESRLYNDSWCRPYIANIRWIAPNTNSGIFDMGCEYDMTRLMALASESGRYNMDDGIILLTDQCRAKTSIITCQPDDICGLMLGTRDYDAAYNLMRRRASSIMASAKKSITAALAVRRFVKRCAP